MTRALSTCRPVPRRHARLAWHHLVFLGLAWTLVLLPVPSTAQRFRLSAGLDDLAIIDDSVVSELVDSAIDVASLPVPPNVRTLQLKYSAAATTEYNLTVEVLAPAVLPPPSYGIAASGIVPTTPTGITLSFNCSTDGSATVRTTWDVYHRESGNRTSMVYYFAKQCATVDSECASCGACIAAGTCECQYKAAGSVCKSITIERTSETALAAWGGDELKLLVWNTFGVANAGETAAEAVARFEEIGDYIRDGPANVVCLQEVFNGDLAQTLVDRLSGRLPHMSRLTFGDGPSRNSGLFFASQFPILEQAFEEFSRATGTDALSDKGIYGALIRLDSDHLAYVFNTHVNAGRSPAVKAVQLSQLRQIKDFMQRRLREAISVYSSSDIAVYLMGDLNTGTVASEVRDAASEVSYDELMTTLQGDDDRPPRDLFFEANQQPRSRECTASIQPFVGCTLGESFDVYSRVDYILAFEKVAGIETQPVSLMAASRTSPQSTLGRGLGGTNDLSDHPAFHATIDLRPDLTPVIVGSVIAGVVIIATLVVVWLVYTGRLKINLPPTVKVYVRQTRILTRKNWLVGIRNRRAVAVQLLVPFIFLGLLYGLQFALSNNARLSEAISVRRHSQAERISAIPRCIVGPGGGPCFTFGYTPSGDPLLDAIMEDVRIASGIPASEVQSWATPDAADVWMDANRNRTQGVFHLRPTFGVDGDGSRVVTALNYTIQYNTTVYYNRQDGRIQPMDHVVAPMQNALATAMIARQFTRTTGRTPSEGFVLNSLKFPHPELVTVDVVGRNGPAFFLGCLMFNFVTQLGQLVTEKELHLRSALRTNGMKSSVYWFTWLVINMMWNFITSVIIVLLGAILQFDFFLKNDPRTYTILFVLFGFAMVPFAFFFSLFLSRSRTATSFGFAMYLVAIMTQGAAGLLFDEQDTGYVIVIRDLMGLLPFATLAKGIRDLGQFSDNEGDTGMKWSERGSYAYFTLEDVYIWLIISFFTFLALTFLFEYLFSTESGDPRWRKWLCQRRATRADPGRDVTGGAMQGAALGLDAVRAEAKRVQDGTVEGAAVTIEGLRKEYYSYRTGGCVRKGTFTAVQDMWLSIPDKQLFCLLGHNGAGKTTTLSMMTGLLNATGGTIKFLGHDLHTDLDAIRQDMGVCPQHDVLWDDLTAAEHIEMFAGLKGVAVADVPAEVATRLESVALLGVAHGKSKTFSGGMRRRLSLACSLTGDPKVVYLDEPTTGMDPVSRREVWTLLEAEKRKRAVILTTHSMEEADTLADRICIMKHGYVRCVGTSLELKKRFGAGFTATIVTDTKVQATEAAAAGAGETLVAASSPTALATTTAAMQAQRLEAAEALVSRMAPSATLARRMQTSLEYRVPGEALPELTRLLETVETEGDAYGISDAQIGLTTLEDVFLSVTADDANDREGKDGGHADAAATDTGAGAGAGAVAVDVADDAPETQGAHGVSAAVETPDGRLAAPVYRRTFNLRAQFMALASKSVWVQSRRKKTLCFQLLLPVAMVFLMFLLQLVVTATVQDLQGKEYIEADLHPPTIPSVFLTPAETFDPETDCPDTLQRPLVDNVGGEWLVSVDADAKLDIDVGAYGPAVAGDASQFWSAGVGYDGPPRAGLLGNLTRDITRMITVKGNVFPRRGNFIVVCLQRPFTMPLATRAASSKDAMEDILFDEWGRRSRSASLAIHELDMTSGKFNISFGFNQTLTAGLDTPHITNLISDAVFRQLAPRRPAASDDPEEPLLIMHGTRDQPIARKLVDFDLISLLGPSVYIFLFQLLFPVVLGGLVNEKQYKLREIMKMMGLKTSVYWTVSYLFAIGLYMLATVLFQLVAIGLDFAYFVKNEYGIVLLLTFLYGNTMIAGAFLLSVFFDSDKTAIVFGYCAVFATGLLAAALIAPFFENKETSQGALFLIQLVPPFTLHRGLLVLRDFVIFDGPGISWADMSDPTVPMAEVMWTLFVLWIVFLLLAAYCEMVVPSAVGIKAHPLFCVRPSWWRRTCSRRQHSAEKLQQSATVPTLPADVAAERQAVWNGGKAADAIRLLDLRVVYKSPDQSTPDKVAVESLSFGVPVGECLGLLGPNGSGKTSAINCLCGYQTPSSGTAIVAGLDILNDIDLVHLSLGVCPQENVLWEELTGREHLNFYGRLKDLRGKELDDEVSLRLRQVELHNDGDKAAGAYSGGMQRRLCVAIALMGSPAVVVLDEPSTGLDPAARRTLWRVIRSCRQRSAVLLTTHSMQEAEQLCDRVGIIVNGHLHTIGSPARMKSEVGDFLKLTVMVEDAGNVPEVEAFVMSLVPEASLLIEPLGSVRQYRLPRSSEGARMSHLLRELEANWARLGISDWAVTNVSLEEVFLKVTSNTRRIGEVAKTAAASAPSTVQVHELEERKGDAAVAAVTGAGAGASAGAGSSGKSSPTIHVSPAPASTGSSSGSPPPAGRGAATGANSSNGAAAGAVAGSARDQLPDSAGLVQHAHATSAGESAV